MQQVPDGYRALKEGQARILYIDSKLTKDSENNIKTKAGGKRQANDLNENPGAVFYNPV